MNTLSKSQLIKQAKGHNLFVTANSNAEYAAKNLLQANDRLIELEAVVQMPEGNARTVAFNNYMKKWWK